MPLPQLPQIPRQQQGHPSLAASGGISDDQLLQMAQQAFPKLPLPQIQDLIAKFKQAGMSNEQIIVAAQYIEEQGQAGAKMMPNLRNKLMGPE